MKLTTARLRQAGTVAYAARGPFEVWFKQQVLDICGIDANAQPMGPECRTVFDWD